MKLQKKPAAVGYLFSAALHSALIVIVVWCAAPVWVLTAPTGPGVQTTVADGSDESGEDTAEWKVSAIDTAGVETPSADKAASADRTSVDSPPTSASSGLGEFARKRLEAARHSVEEKSSEEQLADLESLGRRLGQISSEESVQEVTGTLSTWLGANERATGPTSADNKSSGEFDIDTAQISDVKKLETETGVSYVALLVDAQGNAMESPLDESDGPQLYETFQLMKKFPLLETVYRGAVMGLLDKLAKRTDGAAPKPDAESAEAKD